MVTSAEIIDEIKTFQTNGIPVAIELAKQIGFTIPVVPKNNFFGIDEILNNSVGLFVTATPSSLVNHSRLSDCSVYENDGLNKGEYDKTPLSIWTRNILEYAEVKLNDGALRLLVDNTGAIFRNRIDVIHSRLEDSNG